MVEVETIQPQEITFREAEIAVERRIPIRVHAFDPGRVEFSEDTFTFSVSHRGAHIALKNCVVMGDFLRIVNLEDLSEADFKILGPKTLALTSTSEWVVECVDPRRNIWGLPIVPTSGIDDQSGPWLECRACGSAREFPVTALDMDVLESTGMIVKDCEKCGQPTYWTFNDPQRRPAAYPPFADVAPPPRDVRSKDFINTRKHRRLPLRMAILVRHRDGQEEISCTENISMGGFAAILGFDLRPGDRAVAICPYMAEGNNIEQQVECRWGASVTPGATRRVYGFRFLNDNSPSSERAKNQ